MPTRKNTTFVSENPQLMNEWDVNKNKQIGIEPNKVSIGSQKTAFWICSKHHLGFKQIIRARLSGQNGCPYCREESMKEINRERYIKGKRVLAETHPQIAKEWVNSNNPNHTPNTCLAGSNIYTTWKCGKCGGEYRASIANRALRGSSCPYCAGQKILVGYNDLQTVIPELAKQWSSENEISPTQVTAHSKKKVYWKCLFGHDDYQMSIQQRSNGQGCPICATQSQTSFPEQALFFYIKQVFPDATNRYQVGQKEIDVFVPSINTGIEYNGYYSHRDKTQKDLEKKLFFESKGVRIISIKEIKNDLDKTNADFYIHERLAFKDLNSIIQSVLELISKNTSINVNCAKDAIAIKEQYTILQKEKSIAVLRPDLIIRWDYEKNGTITPEMITLGTKMRYYWKCSICNESYLAPPSRIAKGSVCSKHHNVLRKGENDLETKYPEFLKYWDYSKNNTLPSHVYAGGDKIAFWICENGHSYKKSIRRQIKGESCPICAGKKVLSGFNDLASQFPDVAATWNYSKNGQLLPSQITPYSNKRYWWICKLGHEWATTASNRTCGRGCPYCSNNIVLSGFNDLQTKFPKIAEEWNYVRNEQGPECYLACSSKKVWWKCKSEHEWQTAISNRTHSGTGCPVCYLNKRKK